MVFTSASTPEFVGEKSPGAFASGPVHVKVGGRYRMEEVEIEVDSIEPIARQEITGQLARESGFLGVVDLAASLRGTSRTG